MKTIRMKAFTREGRKPYCSDHVNQWLISGEANLRKRAYRNVAIEKNECFFNDSDMSSDYSLIVVYDKRNCTPLLTARYYHDSNIIARALKGDDNDGPELEITKYKRGIFFMDRMCANTAASLFRKNRSWIHLLFYSELLRKNSACSIIAMARREAGNKLLDKYLDLGLAIAGTVKHKGREHWILGGSMKSCLFRSGIPVASKIFLLMRILIKI